MGIAPCLCALDNAVFQRSVWLQSVFPPAHGARVVLAVLERNIRHNGSRRRNNYRSCPADFVAEARTICSLNNRRAYLCQGNDKKEGETHGHHVVFPEDVFEIIGLRFNFRNNLIVWKIVRCRLPKLAAIFTLPRPIFRTNDLFANQVIGNETRDLFSSKPRNHESQKARWYSCSSLKPLILELRKSTHIVDILILPTAAMKPTPMAIWQGLLIYNCRYFADDKQYKHILLRDSSHLLA